MTRRIVISILVTVWGTLIFCGVSSYFVTRQVMLRNLDESLMARAMSLPEVSDESSRQVSPVNALRPGDRFTVRADSGRTLARSPASTVSYRSQLLRADFTTLPDAPRFRVVTLRTMARPAEGGEPQAATIMFSGSAAEFDTLLGRLAVSLTVSGICGGVIAAGIALLVARRALKPLRATAEIVASIDERTLSTRLNAENLPEELAPVVVKLNQMLERLDQSTRNRQQFFADASHELRTPVAALLTAIEVSLRHPRDHESYRQTLQGCLSDIRLLQQLVETLLEHARSGHAEARFEVQQFDLSAMLNQAINSIRPLADVRGIAISAVRPEQLMVLSQPDRVRSILMNLISNAVEYNRDGGRIDITVVPVDEGTEVSITDTGVGISPEDQKHIFEAFYRVDSSRSAQGKLGLGLYLVQEHIAALRARCSVRSQPGEGTTFKVFVPEGVEECERRQAATVGSTGDDQNSKDAQ